MQRRKFSAAVKLDAVNSVLAGQSVRQVAEALPVHENVLRRWLKVYGAKGAEAFNEREPKSRDSNEVQRLRREIAKLRAERDALAKAKRPAIAKASMLRTTLLDATEQIMVEEGYAAVSTRRVAKKAGVTAAAVHYYFPTTDDLLLAAFRRKKALHDEGVDTALDTENPVRALWKFYTDTARTAIGIEFRAMVNNRKVIREELARDIVESRRTQAASLARYLEGSLLAAEIMPTCLVTIIANIGRGLVAEEVIGVTHGHAETKAFVEGLLRKLEDRIEAQALAAG